MKKEYPVTAQGNERIIGNLAITRVTNHPVCQNREFTIGQQIDQILMDGEGPVNKLVFEFDESVINER